MDDQDWTLRVDIQDFTSTVTLQLILGGPHEGWEHLRLQRGRTHIIHSEAGPEGSYSVWRSRAWRQRGLRMSGCIWFVQNLEDGVHKILAFVVPMRADSAVYLRQFTQEAHRRAHRNNPRELILSARNLVELIRDKVALPEYIHLAVSDWTGRVDKLTWEEEE